VTFAVDSIPAVFRHHARSIYRIHIKRICDSGIADAVLFAGRRVWTAGVYLIRFGGGTGVCGREDVGRAMVHISVVGSLGIVIGILAAGDDNFPACEAKNTQVRKPATIDLS